MKIEVTEQDIKDSDRFGMNDPVMRALQRATDSLWRMSEAGVALEALPPYRTAMLRGEVFDRWRAFKATHTIAPFAFEAQLS